MKARRGAEFFAGIVSVRLAAERAHVRLRRHGFLDKWEMYVANFGDSDFVLDATPRPSGSDVPDIDLATASFPCIDLSLAGNREGLRW